MSHNRQIFLDHASTTPVQPDVLGVMLPFFGNHFASPGSVYEIGLTAKTAVEKARTRVAQFIGAAQNEIVLTSSGTEANNMAVLGTAYAKQSVGNHIITSCIEHLSVLNACRHLEGKGFRVTYLKVDQDAVVDIKALEDAICDDTILISIMHANNEVGTIEPVREIGRIARARGITFHSDAVQSAGRIPLNVDDLNVDLLSIASHKIYGPKGAAALYMRTGTRIDPVLFGSDQETGLRPGTLNVPAVVGFGMACEIAGRDLENNATLIRALRDSLEHQVLELIPGTRINAGNADRLPHISSISFQGVLGDSIGANLDAHNIFVSTGRVFSSYGKDLSPVLAAMKTPLEYAYGTVRLSPGWENKQRDITDTVQSLKTCIERIRTFSGTNRENDVCIFTFPDKHSAVSASRLVEALDVPFTLTGKPQDIRQDSCSPIALACLRQDQSRIASILGEQDIDIAGIHRIDPQCRTTAKKEQDFWAKVEKIKKERA